MIKHSVNKICTHGLSGNQRGRWPNGCSGEEAAAGRNLFNTDLTTRALTASTATIANTQAPPKTAHNACQYHKINIYIQ